MSMGRRLRFLPEGGALVEITCRTVHGRYLLRPGRELNEAVVGVLARAKRLYPVELPGVVYLSGHCHLLLWAENAGRVSEFMAYLNGNVAREAGRLHHWREKFWARRYQSIVVSEEEAAQVERFKYLLSQGVKEGLAARPEDWPGVHCAKPLLTGEPLRGFWFNRTKEYAARQKGQKYNRYTHAEEEILTLDKLRCWRHLSDEKYREHVADLVEEIVDEAAVERRRQGVEAPSAKTCAKAVCQQHPHDAPKNPKKSPAPAFHAATKAAREELRQAYGWFVVAYREAVERLRKGDPRPGFPEGCFPPAMPFILPAKARGP